MYSHQFIALNREAGIASTAISKGIESLNSASFTDDRLYNSAFFNLSIGFERIGKLIIILDYFLDFGAFPSKPKLKEYSHDISGISKIVKGISINRNYQKHEFPDDTISSGIIQTLSEFALETRYYNLDFLSGVKKSNDPISMWHDRVSKPILDSHYSDATRLKAEEMASRIGSEVEPYTAVMHMAEDGTPIMSITAALVESAKIPILQEYSRMYCLRIVRYLSYVLINVGDEFRKISKDTPYFEEYFGIYSCKDVEFRRRKKWGT